MFCTRCGAANREDYRFCKSCSAPFAAEEGKAPPVTVTLVMKPKKPRMAAMLSLLIPGAGQIYNGHVLQGMVILFLCAVIGGATVGFGWVAGMIGSAVHAYGQTREVNRRYAAGLDEMGRSLA